MSVLNGPVGDGTATLTLPLPTRRPSHIFNRFIVGTALVLSTGPSLGIYPSQQTTLLRARPQAPAWTAPNLLQSTLAPVVGAAPFTQTDWARPGRATTLVVAISTRPGPPVVGAQPFAQADWPLPRRSATLLVSTSTRPGPVAGPQPFAQYQWPNPIEPARIRRPNNPDFSVLVVESAPAAVGPYATTQTTFLRGRAQLPLGWTQSNLLVSTLAVAPQPFRPHEWRIPARPTLVQGLLTWTDSRERVLVDTQPFLLTEWPIPSPRRALHSLSSWTDSIQTSTLSLIPPVFPVSRIGDFPNPQHKGRVVDLLTQRNTRQEFHVDIKPFSLTDWPTPLARPALRSLSSWTDTTLTSTLSLIPPAFPASRQADFPNPGIKGRAIGLRTQTNSRQVFHVDETPAHLTAWPNPVLARLSAQTWTQNLLQTTLKPAAPGPFTPVVWTVPDARLSVIAHRTWTQNLLLSTLEPQPFVPVVFTVPEGRLSLRTNGTWTGNLLESTLAELPPIRQHDWPIPTGKGYPVNLRSAWNTRQAFHVDEQPARQTEWPIPAPRPLPPNTWVKDLLTSTLAPPDLGPSVIRLSGDVFIPPLVFSDDTFEPTD